MFEPVELFKDLVLEGRILGCREGLLQLAPMRDLTFVQADCALGDGILPWVKPEGRLSCNRRAADRGLDPRLGRCLVCGCPQIDWRAHRPCSSASSTNLAVGAPGTPAVDPLRNPGQRSRSYVAPTARDGVQTTLMLSIDGSKSSGRSEYINERSNWKVLSET